MSKLTVVQVGVRLVIAAVIYAITMAAAFHMSCLLPNRYCQLGADVTMIEAIAFEALLFTSVGLIATGLLLSPLVVALSRRFLIQLWAAVAAGAATGTVPLVVPCIWAKDGCVIGNWVPFPAYAFALAGAASGGFLWWQWFRHLTTRSSGP